MIDNSYQHDGIGPVPARRRPEGGWDTHGHRKRIVHIDLPVLETFASMMEEAGTPADTTRFLSVYSTETLGIYRTIAETPLSFSDAAKPFQMKPIWHETGAVKRDHILESRVSFPLDAEETVLTGSLLYVGNPLYKCPDATGKREVEVDLELIPDDYASRNHYSRVADKDHYREGLPTLEWDTSKRHTDVYRIALRNMLNPVSERTLTAALITPGMAHVNTVESIAYSSEDKLIGSYPLWLSLPFDFIVKSTGLTHLFVSALRSFPWVDVHDTAKHRALRLSCLTDSYAGVWNRHASRLQVLPWSSSDSRLSSEAPHVDPADPHWNRYVALRSDFARRQALVEIDVLVAMGLGLSLDQLIEMYRTQFHVLTENERATWYDRKGRIVWTCSKNLTGVGWRKKDGKKPSAREWEEIYANLPEGERLECEHTVDFLPGGRTKVQRTYEAPFVTCDREADYRRAWAFFASHEQRQAA